MWYNPLMVTLLRSPLHGILSTNTLVLSLTGRKSGQKIEVPVNYVRTDNTLWVTSLRERHWWRNLRGGAPVELTLENKKRKAFAEACTEPAEVSAALNTYLTLWPQVAKYFGVQVLEHGALRTEDLDKAAKERVAVKITLD